MAYPLDETASMASSDSDNADRVDQDVCQVVCCHFWVTCTDTEVDGSDGRVFVWCKSTRMVTLL